MNISNKINRVLAWVLKLVIIVCLKANHIQNSSRTQAKNEPTREFKKHHDIRYAYHSHGKILTKKWHHKLGHETELLLVWTLQEKDNRILNMILLLDLCGIGIWSELPSGLL